MSYALGCMLFGATGGALTVGVLVWAVTDHQPEPPATPTRDLGATSGTGPRGARFFPPIPDRAPPRGTTGQRRTPSDTPRVNPP